MSAPEVFKIEDFEKSFGYGLAGFKFEKALAATVAREANRLLAERGVRVRVENHHSFGWSGQERMDGFDDDAYDHTALLIAIEPIKRDTAESLLRELIAKDEETSFAGPTTAEFIERARKLLGGEK